MAKSVSQKIKKKPLSEQVKKAMKKYFATLGDTNPKNVYELVMAEVEPELLNEISLVPIKTSIESTDYTIVDNQSELVAAALAIALKPNSEQLSNKVISGNIKSHIIKPMPRPGSLQIKPTSPNSENSILPTLGSVETGLAIVQFGSFENKQLALAEWGRLSENLTVILDGRPKFVERIQRNGNEIYRLRLGGVVNIDDASRFCSAVISQENCVPIIAK